MGWHIDPLRFSALVFGASVLSLCAPIVVSEPNLADKEANRIQEALTKLASGKGDWKLFAVTYDDLHGLHGGLTLTIRGDGKVEQRAVREQIGEARQVTAEELQALIDLLKKHRVWEQRVAERPAQPDESRARLTVKYGDDSMTVWESYNDLPKNRRLLEICERMKKVAWKELRK